MKSTSDLSLRTYIAEVLSEMSSMNSKKKLRIFDFDDTLVTTKSKIHVTAADGHRFDLTPGEYAVYERQVGDVMDYSDFSRLIEPEAIEWTGKILRSLVARGSEVVILTARAAAEPVKEFLRDTGLPLLRVVALADSNPAKKAEYIARRIEEDDINYVEFFDDSPKNVAAVGDLRTAYPHVKIISRMVKPVS
jgi:FMN phosphatase YigB (HAD superfamily)